MATMIHERQNEPTALMTITNLALHNQTLYTMAARPPQVRVRFSVRVKVRVRVRVRAGVSINTFSIKCSRSQIFLFKCSKVQAE